MLQVIITVALLVHGIGHAVGFWMPVPTWFALAWLLPGIVCFLANWNLLGFHL